MLKGWSHLRKFLNPKVILPTLLAAALLLFAFKLGDIGKVIGRLRMLHLSVLGIALGCAACYLGCKAIQLRSMLKHVGVNIPPRPFWLAFAVGELTVTLPLGLFSQNWVLSAARRVNVGRSSAATVMMLLVEIAVVFLFLAVAGIPGMPDVRYGAIAAMVFFTSLVTAVLHFEDKLRALPDRLKHDWAKRAADSGVDLIDGLRRLCKPHILPPYLVLGAIYLGALTTAFWLIGHNLGVKKLDYLDATQIYMFALAVILIGGGLISQIGTIDILGMVVARSFGIDYTNGLVMMLGFRIVWTASIWVWCMPIVGTMWREMPSHSDEDKDKDKNSGDRGKEVSG
ncbi:MAG TPA: lysylphosphatidylglycerol synthase domain-containing protein [Rhodanobacteraceae bacterium]